MMKSKGNILLIGTFDTKMIECGFLRDKIITLGFKVISINIGIFAHQKLFPVDIEISNLLYKSGINKQDLVVKNDRGYSLRQISSVLEKYIIEIVNVYETNGIIGIGGAGGSSIISKAMQVLPLGHPKLLVSSTISKLSEQYIDTKDILLFPSILDLSGLNSVTRLILTNSAYAICGMASSISYFKKTKPVIGITMLGNTTSCATKCRELLELEGFEVMVFHATGNGGNCMESMVKDNIIDGVIDVTTTEIANHLCNGIYSSGSKRMNIIIQKQIPYIVVPGGLDIVVFDRQQLIPEKYKTRCLYIWNENIVLMRTNATENIILGKTIARKINLLDNNTSIIIPQNGFSILGGEGNVFRDTTSDNAFITSINSEINNPERITIVDLNINDEAFAKLLTKELIGKFINKNQMLS